MTAEQMEQAIRGYFDACNSGSAEAVAAYFTEDGTHYFPRLESYDPAAGAGDGEGDREGLEGPILAGIRPDRRRSSEISWPCRHSSQTGPCREDAGRLQGDRTALAGRPGIRNRQKPERETVERSFE